MKKLQAALAQAVSDRCVFVGVFVCVLTLHIVQRWVYLARPLEENKLEDSLRISRKVNLYNTKV